MLKLARALLDLRLQMLPVVLGDIASRLELGCHAIECDRQRVELFQAAAGHADIESARKLAGRLEHAPYRYEDAADRPYRDRDQHQEPRGIDAPGRGAPISVIPGAYG